MSRTVDILKSIQNKETYNKDALSRAEEILKAICNNTSITMTARSRYETLLLCLKNKTKTTLTPRTRFEEILVAIINGTIDSWIVGKNLFNPVEAFNTNEIKDGYKKYTIYTGKPNTQLYVATNTSEEERRAGFVLKCASYDYSETYYWLYSSNTTKDAGVVTTDDEGRISFYWRTRQEEYYPIEKEKEHFYKMQVTIGSTATPYSPYCFLSELEEEYYKTFGV